MFPDADVPVVQLSIDATRSIDELVRLGAALAPLRDEGVLVLGSGNVVHNLREIAWRDADHGEPWALEFDDAARVVMTERPADLPRLAHHPQFRRAAPTPDHFLPLAYVAGLAAAADTTAEVLLDGCTMGSLSMTSYVVAS
jgi:4,5-DOPA dioxygenase extradiol